MNLPSRSLRCLFRSWHHHLGIQLLRSRFAPFFYATRHNGFGQG